MTTLLLDMDGPIAGFDEYGWERMKANAYSTDVDGHAGQRHRYFTDHVLGRGDRRQVRQMTESKGWFRNLPVVPGSQEGVQALLDNGVDVWVCTKPMASNRYCRDEKHAWLREHFPALTDRLIITPNKAMVHGDILLDDAPNPAWYLTATWRPVIFDAPFNRAGSKWEGVRHWTWGDPLDNLLEEV